MNPAEELVVAQAMRVLGLVPAEDLPTIASQALAGGLESEDMAVLAGLGGEDSHDADVLFDAGLRALGFPTMTKEEALEVYTDEMARKIVRRECEPFQGAKAIWRAVIASGTTSHQFDPFVYAASEFEDRPADRAMFEREIVAEATRFLAARGH